MNEINNINRVGLWKLFLLMTSSIAVGMIFFNLAQKGAQVMMLIVEGMFVTGLLSMVFIYLLSPFINWLEVLGVKRILAVTIAYVAVYGSLVVIFSIFSPDMVAEIGQMKNDIPAYVEKINGYSALLLQKIYDNLPFLKNYDFMSSVLPAISGYSQNFLTQITLSFFSALSLMILIPLFSFFILIDGQLFKKSIYALVPNRYFEMTMDMMHRINIQLGSFIRGRVIEAGFVGLVILIGLSPVDIKYVGFLAVFAALANLVPYIGPIIGMAPGLILALLELNSTAQIVWVFVLYILIAQVIVDTFILIPILIAKVANLHPLIVFLAIIIGGNLGGILGMIIAVPFVNIVSIVFTISYKYMFKRKSLI